MNFLRWPFVNLGIGSGIWTPNLPGWWLRMREPHPQIHETHESRGYLVTLYFHIHKVHGPQNLVNPTQKVTCHFDPVVTWQFINVIFLEPQVLWAQNLARCWLFCAYYDRGLRRRKLTNPGISLFPSFFVKKSIYQMWNKPSRSNGKLVLAKNKQKWQPELGMLRWTTSGLIERFTTSVNP